jgi:hypothetical protein
MAALASTTGDSSCPTVVDSLKQPGAIFTSSYEEEKRAMEMAIDWIEQHCEQNQKIAIFTDSQSLCTALLGLLPILRPDSGKNKHCELSPYLSMDIGTL